MDSPHAEDGIFRVLLIWASPDGFGPLKIQEEERTIRECLSAGDYRGSIKIDTLPCCRIDDLHKKLVSGHSDRTYRLLNEVTSKQYRQHQLNWPPPKGFQIEDSFTRAVSKIVDDMETYAATFARSSISQNSSAQGKLLSNPLNGSLFGSPFGHSERITATPVEGYASSSVPATPLTANQATVDIFTTLGQPTPETQIISRVDPMRRVMESSSTVLGSQSSNLALPTPTWSLALPPPSEAENQALAFLGLNPASVIQACDTTACILSSEIDSYRPSSANYDCSGAEEIDRICVAPETLWNNMIHAEKLVSFKLNYPNLMLNSVASFIPQASDTINTYVNVNDVYSFHDLVNIGVGSLCFHGQGASPCDRINVVDFARSLLKQASLRCVIINACCSVIAGHVLRYLIPYTVCMSGRMSDAESLNFSKGFYSALSSGHDFEQAFAHSKSCMELNASIAGTPRRSIHEPGSSRVHLFVNAPVVRARGGSSITALVAHSSVRQLFPDTHAFTRSAVASEAPAMQIVIAQSARIGSLEEEVRRLKDEIISLRSDKERFSSMLSAGSTYLNTVLKEKSELQNQVSELLAFREQTLSRSKSAKRIYVTATASSAAAAPSSTTPNRATVTASSSRHTSRTSLLAKPTIRSSVKPKSTASSIVSDHAPRIPLQATPVAYSAVPIAEAVATVLNSVSNSPSSSPSPRATSSRSSDLKPDIRLPNSGGSGSSSQSQPLVRKKSAPVALMSAEATNSAPPSQRISRSKTVPVGTMAEPPNISITTDTAKAASGSHTGDSDEALESINVDAMSISCQNGDVNEELHRTSGIAACRPSQSTSDRPDWPARPGHGVVEDIGGSGIPPTGRKHLRRQNVLTKSVDLASNGDVGDSSDGRMVRQHSGMKSKQQPQTEPDPTTASRATLNSSNYLRETKKKYPLLTYSPPKQRPRLQGSRSTTSIVEKPNGLVRESSSSTSVGEPASTSASSPAQVSNASSLAAVAAAAPNGASVSLREFIRQRRLRQKQSSSFASVVPRFDSGTKTDVRSSAEFVSSSS